MKRKMIETPKTRSDWLKARSYGIGASDAGTILGVNKWKTNYELWLEKTGQKEAEDIGEKPYVKYGHDAEPFIRGLFALDHPDLTVTYDSPFKIIRNDEHPFIFCTPDGEIVDSKGRRGGFEAKTSEIRNAQQWQAWNDRLPDQYYCQVLHQMLAADWEFVWLRAQLKYTTRNKEQRAEMRDYLIERGEVEDDIETVKAAVIEFWRTVEARKQPGLKLPVI